MDFYIYNRRLPHWRADGATYFVTWRLHSDQRSLDAAERAVIATAIRYFDGARYHLIAFVVMDDHVHVLLDRLERRLERIVGSWKSYTSHVLCKAGRSSPVWQAEYFDRIMRNNAELQETADYIVTNPFKRWPELEAYEWLHPQPA